MDDACPWCGEKLTNPFTGKDLGLLDYDMALEAHSAECESFLEEAGV